MTDESIREFRSHRLPITRMLTQLKSCQGNSKHYDESVGGDLCNVKCKRCMRCVDWKRRQKLDAGIPV
ncbi:hypothetical protein [Mycobacterium interjectum]|uniref:hypothetical protein n=1 Tax=Mycobacterium interjectum TaxID=33895 RepID=UPI000830C567|nr:hypothetical protein [Mycobacterium interjectum]MCV7089459.1 hypothetical protein [Mycobacterium interjectum]